jgi:hypothetical protein
MSSIEVPFEAMPHLQAYSACVADAFNANPDHNSLAVDAVRAADATARQQCSETRAIELNSAINAIRAKGRCVWPGSPSVQRCIEMVETAFQRLDTDFEITSASSQRESL